MVATPTKTLRFDEDVLSVLRNMVWSDDGLTGDITWQLDGKLYQKVKKALTAPGIDGSWDKRSKIHRFPRDPRPAIFGIVDSGKLTVEKDGFFRTPEKVTRYIMGRMALGTADYIWLEPEAGDGAIVKVLLAEGQLPERIYAIERNAARCQALRELGVRMANGDFLKFRNSAHIPFNRILMNPPFENNQDILHVFKAYHLLAERGVLGAIMSEGIFFRENGLAKEFRFWLENVHAYVERLPEGSFKESGTGVATRFIVVRKGVV